MSDSHTATHTLVVGCGLAGLLAAIFAARKGHSVRLLYRGQGALGLGGGTVDVLGAVPGQQGALRSPLDGIPALPEDHPYRLAGEATVHKALYAFRDLTAELGFPYTLREAEGRPLNTVVLTAAGTAKPSCLVPPSMSMAGLEPAVLQKAGREPAALEKVEQEGTAGKIYIVGFAGLKDVYPALMAQGFSRLKRLAGRELVPVTLNCPPDLCPDHFATGGEAGPRLRDLSTQDLARYLDTPTGLAWFIDRLRRAHTPEASSVVLLPPILGTTPDGKVHKAVEAALGCPVHEVLTPPPSISGLRLRTALFAELTRLKVAVTANARITGFVGQNDRCMALVSDMGGREVHWQAERFIMATGGIYGEGLTVQPDAVCDAIFPTAALNPELTPRSPEWSQAEAYPAPAAPGHGFARLGTRVNARFQPLNAAGTPLFANLFYAGRAIGGYDHAAEKSGNGVALVSAYAIGGLE